VIFFFYNDHPLISDFFFCNNHQLIDMNTGENPWWSSRWCECSSLVNKS